MKSQLIQRDDSLWRSIIEKVYTDIDLSLAVAIIVTKDLNTSCMIYQNKEIELEGKSCLCIGNIRCETYDQFQRMLDRVVEFSRARSIDTIIGPMEGSTWNAYRCRLDESKPMFIGDVRVPSAQGQFLKQAGFDLIKTYLSSYVDSLKPSSERAKRFKNRFESKGVVYKKLSDLPLEETLKKVAAFINERFKNNFLFSPIGIDAFVTKMKQMIVYTGSDLTFVAMRDEVVIGFVFGYEQQIKPNEKALVIKTLARDADFQYSGLGTVLTNLSIESALQKGCTSAIHALMAEDNQSVNVSKHFDGKVLSRYGLYALSIKMT